MEKAIPLIVSLYDIVEELEKLFPGRSFTPDGHMVGSIGEAWAKWMFDLELLPSSAKNHDAKAKDGRLVQIKATQGSRSVGMYGPPDHLIVLKLHRSGMADVIYNGPGEAPWNGAATVAKNGQRSISLAKLHALDRVVGDAVRLTVVRQQPAAPRSLRPT